MKHEITKFGFLFLFFNYNFIFSKNIINLLGFIGLYKFCEKSNFPRFVQKSHKFRVLVNMNDMCTLSIF